MRIAIDHLTEYRVDSAAKSLIQQVRLTPSSSALQKVEEWNVRLEEGSLEAVYRDHHGNEVRLFSLSGPLDRVRLRNAGVVETNDCAGVLGAHRGFAPLWLYLRDTPLTAPGARTKDAAATIGDEGSGLDRLHRLNNAIADLIAYRIGETDVTTTAEGAFEAGAGVCQDQAHAFVATARRLGFPARYVSGYLAVDEEKVHEASHAWAEAHIDGLGWVGFDPANRQSPDGRYVRLAVGLDYRDAAPVRGVVIGGGMSAPMVTVQIQQ